MMELSQKYIYEIYTKKKLFQGSKELIYFAAVALGNGEKTRGEAWLSRF